MATLLLGAIGCSDVVDPTVTGLARGELLILPLEAAAPAPPAATFWVKNSELTVQRIRHADGMGLGTLFAELQFPARSLADLNGTALADADSVLITVTASPGEYGLTVTAIGVSFFPLALPSISFSFAVYADVTVIDESPTYALVGDYVGALNVWLEGGDLRWSVAAGSAATGSNTVSAVLERPGAFLLAAPR